MHVNVQARQLHTVNAAAAHLGQVKGISWAHHPTATLADVAQIYCTICDADHSWFDEDERHENAAEHVYHLLFPPGDSLEIPGSADRPDCNRFWEEIVGVPVATANNGDFADAFCVSFVKEFHRFHGLVNPGRLSTCPVFVPPVLRIVERADRVEGLIYFGDTREAGGALVTHQPLNVAFHHFRSVDGTILPMDFVWRRLATFGCTVVAVAANGIMLSDCSLAALHPNTLIVLAGTPPDHKPRKKLSRADLDELV